MKQAVNQGYEVEKNYATGQKTYFPIVSGKVDRTHPCKKATEAQALIEPLQIEADKKLAESLKVDQAKVKEAAEKMVEQERLIPEGDNKSDNLGFFLTADPVSA